MLNIDRDTARRFILGRQGLWPGRRWRGIKGTEAAMRAAEHLLDPLTVVARSQDSCSCTAASWNIWPRSVGGADLRGRRKFFDWGGWLAVRPMEELPYWRVRGCAARGRGAALKPAYKESLQANTPPRWRKCARSWPSARR